MKTSGKVIVTGAKGFIGGKLISTLRSNGVEVIGWTRELGDLRDKNSVKKVLKDVCPEKIFHLASISPSNEEQNWTIAADEVKMLTNLATQMKQSTQLIYTGSMAEYGSSGVFDENSARNPNTVYGFSKAAGVDRAITLATSMGLDIRVARLFGVYGPGESKNRLIPYLINKLLSGTPVSLSDGLQIRDFIHVLDVCKSLIAISNTTVLCPSVINVGTGVGLPVEQVIRMICNRLGADENLLKFGVIKRKSFDEDKLVADITLLTKLSYAPAQHWLNTESGPAFEYVESQKGKSLF